MLVTYVDFMKDFLLVSTEGADSGSAAGCDWLHYMPVLRDSIV